MQRDSVLLILIFLLAIYRTFILSVATHYILINRLEIEGVFNSFENITETIKNIEQKLNTPPPQL